MRSRPPADPRRERGQATAETAAALPALAAVLALCLAAIQAVAAHLACVDAARAGARALARGDDRSAVLAAVAEAAPPGASASVVRSGGYARVEVTARVRLGPGLPAPVEVGGRAATPLEGVGAAHPQEGAPAPAEGAPPAPEVPDTPEEPGPAEAAEEPGTAEAPP
ncbi:TadE family type IV pilus minor pilin [Nocardiopsis potens]|uniref:TadE family type IV pilus minor pilin n=1 Tax=Nocardiopsis potens TaxID=1246458 RepID=UPI00034D5DCB|nr:TadE family type IV pilus minor pilin [Nocardiopsis potens]